MTPERIEQSLLTVREPQHPVDGDCLYFTTRITAALSELGAVTVHVLGWADAEASVLVYAHLATLVQGHIVDFTARQFQLTCPVPARWIAPQEDYLRELAEVTGVHLVTIGCSQRDDEPASVGTSSLVELIDEKRRRVEWSSGPAVWGRD